MRSRSRSVPWWAWLVIVLALVGVAATGVALVVHVARGPEHGRTLVRVLKLFLSWPVTVLVLGLAFGVAFRRELAGFLERLAEVKGPWGIEARTREQEEPPATLGEKRPPVGDQPPPDGSVTLSTEGQQVVREIIEDLQQQATDANQAVSSLSALLARGQQEAVRWWIAYLLVYLVPKTKTLLQLIHKHPSPREFFERYLKERGEERDERQAMFSALEQHQLIHEDDAGDLRTTSQGEFFVRFLEGAQAIVETLNQMKSSETD